jgi:hypothetical protein
MARNHLEEAKVEEAKVVASEAIIKIGTICGSLDNMKFSVDLFMQPDFEHFAREIDKAQMNLALAQANLMRADNILDDMIKKF